MAELFKNKNKDLNLEIFNGVFNISSLKTYEQLYLLSNVGEEKKMFEEFNKTLLNKNKMVFISSSPEDYAKNDLYFKELKKYFRKYKINELVLIDNRTSKFAVIKHIKDSDIVFLMGGNPTTQLEFIKSYEINILLEDYEGIIIGMSAGAINLGKKSYVSKDKDFEESFIYDGLGLTDITVNPHFDFKDAERKKEFLKGDNIIGLPDNSFIKVDKFSEVIYFGAYYIKNGDKIKKVAK